MSYILTKAGEQVAVSGSWNPTLFSRHTSTSYPASVTAEYLWVQDDWRLFWEDDPVPEPQPVPDTYIVSMRQARLALLEVGMLTDINAALAAMPGKEGEAARIEWEYAQEVRKDSPLVMGIAVQLGLTDQQITDLFNLAGSIE